MSRRTKKVRAVPIIELDSLLGEWLDYQETSLREMRKAKRRGDVSDAKARQAEIATLSVCIGMLSVVMVSQSRLMSEGRS